MYFTILLAGFLGGVVRGLVGYIKHQFSYKNVPFKLNYFLGMSSLSGLIGLTITIAIYSIGFTYQGIFNPGIAFVIGYAGGDFVENVFKIIIKKSSLYRDKDKK